ncbi:MAG: hypothetical protein WDZ76_11200 [Pseudohongiellaceae bacterium]
MKPSDIDRHFREEDEKIPDSDKREPASENRVVGNRSGYLKEGSENFEHDDTGDVHNYSGVEDAINSANAEHEGWEEGLDY